MKYILLLFIGLYLYNSSIAQERKLVYDVVRNDKVIGEINFVEMIQGQKKFLSLNSNVETSMIITIKDHTAETAGFDKGIMLYSSYHQNQTGSDELNKMTKLSGKAYQLTVNGQTKLLNLPPVRYNTLLLYTHVPKNVNKVWSGNFQQMLDLKKISDNKYRLLLPDGKFNDYTYTNGICSKVEIVRSMGMVQFVLREQKSGTGIPK